MIAIARLDQLGGHVADLFKCHRRILEALLIDGQTVADQITAALIRLVVHAGVLTIGLNQAVKVLASLRAGKHVLRRRQNLVICLGGYGLQLRVGFIQRRLSGRHGLFKRRNLLVIAGLGRLVIGRGILRLQIVKLLLRVAQRGVRGGNRAVQVADFALLLVAELDEQVLHTAVTFRHIVIRRAVVLGGHITGRSRVIAFLLGGHALVKFFLHLLVRHRDVLGGIFANLFALHAGGLVLHEIIARIADGVQVVDEHLVELIVGDGRLALRINGLGRGRLAAGRLGRGRLAAGRLFEGGQTRFFLFHRLQIRIVLVADHHLVEVKHVVGVAFHVGSILFGQRLEAKLLHLILKHDALNQLLDSGFAVGGDIVVRELHRHAEVLLEILLVVAGQIIPVSLPLRLGDLGGILTGLHLRHNLRAVKLVVVADQVAAGEQHQSRKQQRNQRESLIHVRSLPFSLYSAIYDLL